MRFWLKRTDRQIFELQMLSWRKQLYQINYTVADKNKHPIVHTRRDSNNHCWTCCCCCISPPLGCGGCMCGAAIACITSGFIGGGIRAFRTRNSIIRYHSGSAPAFSCSSVICCRCPISLTQARRQSTLPCTSWLSSGDRGMGPGIGPGIGGG